MVAGSVASPLLVRAVKVGLEAMRKAIKSRQVAALVVGMLVTHRAAVTAGVLAAALVAVVAMRQVGRETVKPRRGLPAAVETVRERRGLMEVAVQV